MEKVTRGNPHSWFDAVWEGLHLARDHELIPDAHWDEICTAMAWLAEEHFDNPSLANYGVVWYDAINDEEPPHVFLCQAENIEHAEEQCYNAYPDTIIVATVYDVTTAQEALDVYNDPGNQVT